MNAVAPAVLSEKVAYVKTRMEEEINTFQILARHLNTVASEPSVLSGYEMTKLVTANDKAGVALTILDSITSFGDNEKRLLMNLDLLFQSLIKNNHSADAIAVAYSAILDIRFND